MSWSSFRSAAELSDPEYDDCQPSYICAHCQKPAKGAVAITLTPWKLSEPATAGWICGGCHGLLRVWLGDEPSP